MADTSINDQDSQSIVYARAAIIDRRTGVTLFRVRNITRCRRKSSLTGFIAATPRMANRVNIGCAA
jgi:hypothetical protein